MLVRSVTFCLQHVDKYSKEHKSVLEYFGKSEFVCWASGSKKTSPISIIEPEGNLLIVYIRDCLTITSDVGDLTVLVLWRIEACTDKYQEVSSGDNSDWLAIMGLQNMLPYLLFVFISFALISNLHAQTVGCPTRCLCFTRDNGMVVRCMFVGLTEVPKVPRDTAILWVPLSFLQLKLLPDQCITLIMDVCLHSLCILQFHQPTQ